MMKRFFLVLLGAALICPLTAYAAEPATTPGGGSEPATVRQWRFQVLLGDKDIGQQSFKLDRRGDRSTVSIAADFNVKYVALSFYAYKHRNTEVWQGNCLVSMNASTDDNGEKLAVDGGRTAGGFQVKATKGQLLLPECIMSFAYWNPDFLRQNRLLNSQTGKFEDIVVTKLGTERIEVRRESVEATRYKVKGEGIDIDLWYAGDREWVRLESEVNKSRLIYRLI